MGCWARLPNKQTVFVPINLNGLPKVPKPPEASQTASLVVNNFSLGQYAITRLENR